MFQCGTIWWSTNKNGIIYLIFRQTRMSEFMSLTYGDVLVYIIRSINMKMTLRTVFFFRAVDRSKFQRVVWSLCLNLRNSSQSLLSGNIAVCHLESCRFLDNLTWSKDLPTSSNKRQESVTSVPLQHEFLHPPKSKCISGPQPLFPTAVPILKYPWHQQKVKGSNIKHNHLKPFQRPWFLPIPKSYNEHLCIHTNITWHYTTLHYIALHCITLHCIPLHYMESFRIIITL